MYYKCPPLLKMDISQLVHTNVWTPANALDVSEWSAYNSIISCSVHFLRMGGRRKFYGLRVFEMTQNILPAGFDWSALIISSSLWNLWMGCAVTFAVLSIILRSSLQLLAIWLSLLSFIHKLVYLNYQLFNFSFYKFPVINL